MPEDTTAARHYYSLPPRSPLVLQGSKQACHSIPSMTKPNAKKSKVKTSKNKKPKVKKSKVKKPKAKKTKAKKKTKA
jgi:hypothetical protein